jgi:cold shock protein
MKKGKVKFFNASKGYGFIIDEESQEEVFVHVTGVESEIQKDDDVTYDVIEGKKGLNAINVRPA